MDLQRIVIVAIAVVVAVAVVGRRKFAEIRAQMNDPTQQAVKEFGLLEKLRLGRVARSEQMISDPQESRRAELAARASLFSIERNLPRREVLLLPVVLLFVTISRSEAGDVMFWVEVGLLVSMALAFLWWRRSRRQILRTASLNGWDLSDLGPDIPQHVRTTTVANGPRRGPK